MPQIPVFENQIGVPTAPGPPRVSIDQFAAPGQALTQTGGAVSDEGQRWLQQYAEAKRTADASGLVADGMKALSDKRFIWSKVDDNEAAYAGYQKDASDIVQQTLARTSDPQVQSYVQRELTTQSIIDAQNTRNAAFQLESSKRRGQLDTTLSGYAQQAALASDDLTRAHYIDLGNAAIGGAVAGRWLAPQEGDDRKLSFGSQVAEVNARRLGATDPIQAAHILQDPALTAQRFPGLQPEKAASLAGEMTMRAMRVEGRNAAAQAHADAMAERQFHQLQAQNETNALVAIHNNQTIDADQLTDLAHKGLISPGGLNTIFAAQREQGHGEDQTVAKLALYDRLQHRQLTSQDIYDAVGNRSISGSTATTLMQAIGEQGKTQENAVDRGNYSTLLTAIGEAADGQSVFSFTKDADRAANAALRAQAKQEWTQRVVIGQQDSNAVLQDMLGRYQRAPADLKALPKPLYGAVTTSAELQQVAVRTYQALQAGQITQAVYDREVDLLNRLRGLVTVPTVNAGAGKSAPARGGQ